MYLILHTEGCFFVFCFLSDNIHEVVVQEYAIIQGTISDNSHFLTVDEDWHNDKTFQKRSNEALISQLMGFLGGL